MGKAAVVQSVGLDPKELFDPSSYPAPTYLGPRILAITGVLGGLLLGAVHNHGFKRPVFSGLPRYAAYMAIGLAAGIFCQNRNELYWAERDAIYRHYIELHPEDFKANERVVVGDMFKTWVPIR